VTALPKSSNEVYFNAEDIKAQRMATTPEVQNKAKILAF
jgi:hypothetical protein